MKKLLEFTKEHIKIIAISLLTVTLVVGGLTLMRDQQQERNAELLKQLVPDGRLVYGADDSAPPVRFVDEDGVYKGVVVDYMNLLSLELGIEIQAVPYEWEEGLEALKKGETDLCDMFASEERSKDYVFTDSIYTLRVVVAVRAGEDYQLEDIDRLTIATQKGDYANEFLRENYPNAQQVFVHDVGEGLKLLLAGQVDAIIGDEPVALYYIDDLGCEAEIQILEPTAYEAPVVLAMPKKNQHLIPIINDAIQAIEEKGQLEKIQQKWFGISTPLIINKSNAHNIRIAAIALLIIFLVAAFGYVNGKTLKKQVVRRTHELEVRKNELQLVMDKIPEGLALVNCERQVISSNYKLFRAKAEKNGEGICACSALLGDFCGREKCLSEEECLVSCCLREGRELLRKEEQGNQVYELRGVPADLGSDEEGGRENKAVLVVVRDITMDEANSRQLLLSSKMAAIGQLAAGMAHQIRNPLGIIRNQSYILRKNGGDSPQTSRSLNYIDDSVKRASDIIDNVMNFWRISRDEIRTIKLHDFLQSVLLLQAEGIAKKKLKTVINCSDELLFEADEEALKHILHNLVANSIDAMEQGGTLTLEGTLKDKKAGRVLIRCRDTGCGISAENMQNLFNPFFTTKEPGKGTGLGLFIVYSEVQRIGGRLDVKSKEGRGTEFTVDIPVG